MMIRNRYLAAVNDKPWWLAGGIPPGACVAAYQAVGASDYAASKVNLANPGTYNCTDGAAYPTWDAVNGWIFPATGNEILNTGFTFTSNNLSIFVRFIQTAQNSTLKRLVSSNGETVHMCTDNGNQNNHIYKNGTTELQVVPTLQSAGNSVMGISGSTAYLNGVVDGTITLGNLGAGNLSIGNRPSDLARVTCANIYAVSVYVSAITSAQVAALTTAMNAL